MDTLDRRGLPGAHPLPAKPATRRSRRAQRDANGSWDHTNGVEHMILRYGIGEIYGENLSQLSPKRRRELVLAQTGTVDCPFRQGGGKCRKPGGVCTLKLVRNDNGVAVPATGAPDLVTLCPMRFLEASTAVSWIGSVLLGTPDPLVLQELPFLLSIPSGPGASKPVGKIDAVLVHPETSRLCWCCLEMQAVYFSGKKMGTYLKRISDCREKGVPFPKENRRPDFRSSGPKRLMPQLQIKVPTLSRWGKKTAVLVDRAFWDSLGTMGEVEHVSNCDIAWFVVRFEEKGRGFTLARDSVHFTTLDRAVEGLTAGRPTSLDAFEKIIRDRVMGRKSRTRAN